jgi:hypothetical protein
LKKALTIGATSINYLLVGSYLKKEAESKWIYCYWSCASLFILHIKDYNKQERRYIYEYSCSYNHHCNVILVTLSY